MPLWLLTLWNYRKAIAIGLVILAVFSAGYETRVKLDEADEAARLVAEAEARKEAQDKADKTAAAWEKQLAGMRDANRKLTGRLNDETNKAVYANCIVPSDGVQIFNDALSGDQSSGERSASVP